MISGNTISTATVGSLAGYVFIIGEVAERRPQLVVPPHWQITTVAVLVLSAIVVSSILAEVRRAVEAYSALQRTDGGEP